MTQQTLAMAADQGGGFERYRRRTKREDFLDAMEAIVPWAELCAVIEPHYPKAGSNPRPYRDRLARPRTPTRRATPRCTRRARVNSGTSG